MVFLCWKRFSITVKKSTVSKLPTFSIITSRLSLRSILHLPAHIYGHMLGITIIDILIPSFFSLFFKGGEPFIITPLTELQRFFFPFHFFHFLFSLNQTYISSRWTLSYAFWLYQVCSK